MLHLCHLFCHFAIVLYYDAVFIMMVNILKNYYYYLLCMFTSYLYEKYLSSVFTCRLSRYSSFLEYAHGELNVAKNKAFILKGLNKTGYFTSVFYCLGSSGRFLIICCTKKQSKKGTSLKHSISRLFCYNCNIFLLLEHKLVPPWRGVLLNTFPERHWHHSC